MTHLFLQKNFFKFAIAAVVFSLIGCASTKKNEISVGAEISMGKTTFSPSQAEYDYGLFPEYHMQPGDVLDILFQIQTWVEREKFLLAIDHVIDIKFVHAPELNESQRIRPDGTVSLPYIGKIRVVGKTLDQLTKELQSLYTKILRKPEIYVLVPEFRSRIKELKADLHTAPRGLSRLTTVRPDGYATFPMVGDVFVANRTLPDVNEALNNMYDKILPGLHVDLFLEVASDPLVYVLGEVKTEGPFKIVKPISVVDALTLAGGVIRGARLDSVMVIRRYEKKIIATRLDIKSLLAFKGKQKLFYLQRDDIVYVPKTWIKNAAEVMRDIADIVLFNGWSTGLGFSWQLHDAGGRN